MQETKADFFLKNFEKIDPTDLHMVKKEEKSKSCRFGMTWGWVNDAVLLQLTKLTLLKIIFIHWNTAE